MKRKSCFTNGHCCFRCPNAAIDEFEDREYEALSKERSALMHENYMLRTMLKAAIEALNAMAENVRDECGEAACGLCEYDSPLTEYGEMLYECEGVNGKTDCFKWKHYEESIELLGDGI